MSSEPFAWTHEKTRVEFDGRELVINDKRLPLDEIDRLARLLERSTAQGSWNRLDCQEPFLAHGKETVCPVPLPSSKTHPPCRSASAL